MVPRIVGLSPAPEKDYGGVGERSERCRGHGGGDAMQPPPGQRCGRRRDNVLHALMAREEGANFDECLLSAVKVRLSPSPLVSKERGRVYACAWANMMTGSLDAAWCFRSFVNRMPSC